MGVGGWIAVAVGALVALFLGYHFLSGSSTSSATTPAAGVGNSTSASSGGGTPTVEANGGHAASGSGLQAAYSAEKYIPGLG